MDSSSNQRIITLVKLLHPLYGMRTKCFTLSIVLCVVFMGSGQESTQKVSDSLQYKSYDSLIKATTNTVTLEKKGKGKHYMQVLLDKAKKEKNAAYIVQGYFYLYYLNDDPRVALQYIDSAIVSSRNLGHSGFGGSLLTAKGGLHYTLKEYKQALDSYLEAKKIAEEQNDSETLMHTEYNIGLIQFRIGANNEALNSFRNYYDQVLKADLKYTRPELYLQSIEGLSEGYLNSKQIDSATFYVNLLINEAKKYDLEKYFILAKGKEAIISYHHKKYEQSIDSILKYLPYIEKTHDSLTMSFTHFYLGKSYAKLKQWETAVMHLQKADSIIQNNQIYLFELRENYDILHTYFKEKEDLRNQLLYLERLIGFDSVLYNNNTYLKNTLLTKYENPKLFKEKEKIISKLEDSGEKKSLALYTTLLLVIGLLILLTFNYQKRLKYKKRFETLITEDTTELSPILIKKSVPNKEKEVLAIPEVIVNEILEKLKQFEKQEEFINPKITLNGLAKSLRTNSNYLSKIINHHKEKNFSSYISDMRIAYVIKALQSQPKLREYTIKAIAFEVGFKNAESFTNAFYKQTKIYPSYFIKQLKKQGSST